MPIAFGALGVERSMRWRPSFAARQPSVPEIETSFFCDVVSAKAKTPREVGLAGVATLSI